MSEAKNTALGGFGVFRYSQLTQATHHFNTLPAMITALIVLSALVLVTAWDDTETQSQ